VSVVVPSVDRILAAQLRARFLAKRFGDRWIFVESFIQRADMAPLVVWAKRPGEAGAFKNDAATRALAKFFELHVLTMQQAADAVHGEM
jgi:hypothetical protein